MYCCTNYISFSFLPLDKSTIPRRIHAVTGVSLLWQPEVVFPYLALLEKFTSTPELMEAAAGAIQNLTACAWKVLNVRSSCALNCTVCTV